MHLSWQPGTNMAPRFLGRAVAPPALSFGALRGRVARGGGARRARGRG